MNPEVADNALLQTAGPGRLWQRAYLLLFLSRLIKVLAENFANLAFMWLLFEAGGTAFSTSMLYFAMLAPQMVLSLLVGPLLARGRLTRWMFASDAVRALLVLLIPLCYEWHALPIWLFYVAGIIQSCCGSVYNPASSALLPAVVEKPLIQKANSTLVSAQQIIYLVGLMGAGALVTLLSASLTLVITTVLFLGSAILILFVRPTQTTRTAHEPTAKNQQAQDQTLSYWQNIRLGFAIVRQHKLIFLLNVFCIFLNVGYAPWDSLLPLYVYQGYSGNASALTFVRLASTIGALLIGLLLARVQIKRHGALFALAGLTQGIALTLVGATHGLWLLILIGLVTGMSATAVNVPEAVIVQTSVPLHQQPQVWGVITTISSLLLPFTGLVIGGLSTRFGTGTVISGGGALIVLSGLVVLLCTPIAKLRPETKQ